LIATYPGAGTQPHDVAPQAQLTLLRQHVFDQSEIMQQPLADKPEEIEAELRILEI
jgi:hypothetical protein